MNRDAEVTLREDRGLLPPDAVFGLSVDRLGPIRAEDFERRCQSEPAAAPASLTASPRATARRRACPPA